MKTTYFYVIAPEPYLKKLEEIFEQAYVWMVRSKYIGYKPYNLLRFN